MTEAASIVVNWALVIVALVIGLALGYVGARRERRATRESFGGIPACGYVGQAGTCVLGRGHRPPHRTFARRLS